jgi:hypothetical protein
MRYLAVPIGLIVGLVLTVWGLLIYHAKDPGRRLGLDIIYDKGK